MTIKGSLLMSFPIIKRFWRNVRAPCNVTQGRGSQITTYRLVKAQKCYVHFLQLYSKLKSKFGLCRL